jgi:hypothetical protein
VGLKVARDQAEAAGIADTYHNLTATGPGTIKGTGITEICVFCHTPHFGATTAEDSGPLWNRTLSEASYTLYSSPTLDATTTQPTSVSKACLSCHDGTVGMNQLRNRPGSGFGTNPANGGDTKITSDGSGGAATATLIGTDLSNDHPVSMVYADAKSPGLGTVTLGEDLHTSGFRPAVTTSGRTVVDGTAVAGTAPATGIKLPLYNLKVECASCHDPHEARTKSIVDPKQVWFLRASNDGSAVCRTCHLK